MAQGVNEIQRLREAGFTDEEVASWAGERRRTLLDAGFSESETDEYFGRKPFRAEPIQKMVERNMAAATQPQPGEDGKPAAAKPAKGFTEALEAGLQISVSGLLARGKAPSKALSPEATFAERLGSNLGTLGGDLPFMIGGALLGGGAGLPSGPGAVVTGAAGAFGLPAGLRATIMDAYTNGEVTDVKDFFNRAGHSIIETIKGQLIGAATAGAGLGAKALLPATAPKVVQIGVPTAAEITAMVGVGAALEGHVPSAQDFLDAAVLVGGLKASVSVAGKLRTIYARTGIKPDEVARQAEHNPTIKQDLLSRDVEMPKALEPLVERAPQPPAAEAPKTVKTEAAWRMKDKDRTTEPSSTNLAELTADVKKSGVKEPIEVTVSPENRAYVTDGNNRLAAARAAGIEDIPVKFVRQEAPFTAEQNAKAVPLSELGIRPEDIPTRQRTQQQEADRAELRRLLEGEEKIEPKVDAEMVRQSKVLDGDQPSPPIALPQLPAPRAAGGGKPPKEPPLPVPRGAGGDKSPEQAILDRIGSGEKGPRRPTFDEFYTTVVDDLHPLKRLQQAFTGAGAEFRFYDYARLTRGAFGKADQFLEHATFNYTTLQNVGKGLKQVLKPLEKIDGGLDKFRAYAVAARALELESRGIESGMPIAEARAVVRANRGQMEPVFKELQEYQNALVAYLRDSGILSKDAYESMLEANKNYVPFYRLFGEEFGSPGAPGKGFSVRNPIKTIKGSDLKIIDPIESIIKNTYLYVTLAERNGVGRELYRAVQAAPEFAESMGIKRVPTPIRPIEVTAKETGVDMVAQFMREHGFNVTTSDTITIFRAMRQPTAKDEVRFFDNGKVVTLRVPEPVAEAMKGMDHKSFGLLLNIAAAPARLLRAGVTLSPEFMARNFTRDQLSAFILSMSGFRPIWDTLRGFGSLVGKDAHYQEWLKAGGANSAFVSIDRTYIQNNVFKLSKETGLLQNTWNVVRSPLEALRVVSELVENSTRIGEFRMAREAGRDMPAAGLAAREVTLDFQRVGAKMRALNMMTAFLNPGIQGIDRIMRAFKEHPTETTFKTLAAVTLPSIILWAVNHDDPRWKEIPQWQKDMFWIVFTDNAVFRIPKPFELGVIFGSLPERVLEAYFTENPEAFKEFQRSVIEGMTPNYMPTWSIPIIEQFANKSTFTGNPIVPQHLEGLLPEYRYNEYTSETMKLLGSMIAAFPGMKHADLASPAVIENYWRAWTGGMGMYALQIADKALVAAGVVPDPVKPAHTVADLPIIKAFVVRHPTANAQPIQDFYNRYYERKQVYDTVMALAREGNAEAAEKEYALAPNAVAELDGMREALTNISKMVRMIHKNPDATPQEKRQLIDTLYMQMILIAREGNNAMDAIDKAVGPGVEKPATD